MLTTEELTKLVDWFVARKLLPKNYRDLQIESYRTACRTLTTEQLRYGCEQVMKKHIAKAPHPLLFRQLCEGSWMPADFAVGKSHIEEMKKRNREAVMGVRQK